MRPISRRAEARQPVRTRQSTVRRHPARPRRHRAAVLQRHRGAAVGLWRKTTRAKPVRHFKLPGQRRLSRPHRACHGQRARSTSRSSWPGDYGDPNRELRIRVQSSRNGGPVAVHRARDDLEHTSHANKRAGLAADCSGRRHCHQQQRDADIFRGLHQVAQLVAQSEQPRARQRRRSANISARASRSTSSSTWHSISAAPQAFTA